MALDPNWPMRRQFERDRGGKNPFGLPSGFFVSVGLDGHEYEHEVDIDVHPSPAMVAAEAMVGPTLGDCLDGRSIYQRYMGQIVWGIQFLCPLCHSGLYVPSLSHPSPRTAPHKIVVHWDKLVKSNQDGKERPTFSVDGALSCDYLNTEIDGIPRPATTTMRCAWRGRIENGRCYDDSIVRGKIVRTFR